MEKYLIWIFAGLFLSYIFFPKESKPKVKRTGSGLWKRMFQPLQSEKKLEVKIAEHEETERSDFVELHKDFIKIFYCVRRYELKKSGAYSVISAYMVKPENYFGFVYLGQYEALDEHINIVLTKIIANKGLKGKVVISKI